MDLTVFQIENPKIVEIMTAFAPWIGKMDYDHLHNKYVVVGYPTQGQMQIMDAYELGEKFDFVMPGITITTAQVRKR